MSDILTIEMTNLETLFMIGVTTIQKRGANMKIVRSVANIGDEIISAKGIKGKVIQVKENSVIIEILENLSEYEFLNNRTVVSHKHYFILSIV